MFARISSSVLVTVSIALLAVATSSPTVTVTVTAPASTATSASTCSTGDLQSCESVEPASSSAGAAILSLLDIVVEGVDVLLGIDCTPITVVGVGSTGGQVVCCEDNNTNDLISIGCVPIII